MASTYPATLDAFSTTFVSGNTITSANADNVNDAINKIEAELGTLPKGTFATVKARLDALAAQVITNSQSGTTYTLVLTDEDKVVELTNAATVTVTVPTNASVAFAVGAALEVFRYGAGEVQLAAAGGVTIRSPGGGLRLNQQYSSAVLRKRATDEWVFQGDIKV